MTTAIQRTSPEAIELDHQIDDAMRSFVELGMKLMEMRDSGLYRQLPNPFKDGQNFTTFEEYAAAKGQIGKRYAAKLIRSSLTYRALGPNGSQSLPTTERQVRVLAENVVVFDTEDRPLPDGAGARATTVGVANPDELATVWRKVADKYEKTHAKDPRRKLSATFIYDALPRQYQRGANPKIQIKDPRLIGRIQRNGQKFLDLIGYPDKWDLEEIKTAAEKESWSADDVAGLRDVLKDVTDYVSTFRAELAKYRAP